MSESGRVLDKLPKLVKSPRTNLKRMDAWLAKQNNDELDYAGHEMTLLTHNYINPNNTLFDFERHDAMMLLFCRAAPLNYHIVNCDDKSELSKIEELEKLFEISQDNEIKLMIRKKLIVAVGTRVMRDELKRRFRDGDKSHFLAMHQPPSIDFERGHCSGQPPASLDIGFQVWKCGC